MNKMAVSAYLSLIALNVNELNAYWMDKKIRPIYKLSTRASLQFYRYKDWKQGKENVCHANVNKKARAVILISD